MLTTILTQGKPEIDLVLTDLTRTFPVPLLPQPNHTSGGTAPILHLHSPILERTIHKLRQFSLESSNNLTLFTYFFLVKSDLVVSEHF